MPTDLNNPIPQLPEGLLQMLASVPSKQAAGRNALWGNLMPGINSALGTGVNYAQKNAQSNRIAQLLQKMRGGQQQSPQMPQGQPQAQAPFPNPMAQAMGGQNDPLGLFGGQ